MTHDKDKILLRAKDIGLLVLVLTFFGMLAGPLKRIFQLNETIEKVQKLEDNRIDQERNMAIIRTQLEGLSKQLDQVSWQLRRIGRDRG